MVREVLSMLRCLIAFLFLSAFVLGQEKVLQVEQVKGRAWLVVNGKRQKLEVGKLSFGAKIECERGAKAKVVMPDGSYAVLLPPSHGCVTTSVTFDKTSEGKDAAFLDEGALKALFATKRFCVVAGRMFLIEPLPPKHPEGKFLAEVIVRLVKKKKESWWSVFAVTNNVKVLLSDSGAEITIPENEVALLRFLEEKKEWQIKADEANEKNVVLRGRDGAKKELTPNEVAEVYADKKDTAKYGLVVPPPPPPEARLRRERLLQLPKDRPYEDAGEVQEAPYVTPKKP